MAAGNRRRTSADRVSVVRAASFTLEQIERRLLFASISGVVYGDLNSNGLRDPGEPGLAGWTVYLDQNDNSVKDVSEVSTVTDGSGAYTFAGINAATYRVREVVEPGWVQTSGGATLPAPGAEAVGNAPVVNPNAGRSYTGTEVIARVNNTRGLRELDRYLIANPNTRLADMVNLNQSGQIFRQDGGSLVVVTLRPGANVTQTIAELEKLAIVDWVQPNYIYDDMDPREFVPNDPSYGSQYHHPKMQNNLAWDTTLGSPDIKIGVTDDGVMLNHPDLQQNIWVNTGETAGNGIDDDGNGYIDDVNGWDFTNSTTPGTGDSNPLPATSGGDHGTHVAGIAAARTNNGVGVSGTAGGSTIVPLRFYGTGSWTSTVISNTYRYAADNGLQIVTTSYNVDGFANDAVFAAALQYMYDRGVLHFNSAGNNNALNPPRQKYDTTLYVASTTSSDTRAGTSNYGWGIDIAAPGDSVFNTAISSGTFPNYVASYETKSGTSMATPNAAGAAALIWSANPTWTRDQVAAKLLGSTDNIDGINPTVAGLLGRGRVNSFKSLTQSLAAPRFRNNTLAGLPAENATVTTVNSTFTLDVFNVFDPATMNASNFEIRGAGYDDVFGTTDDTVIPVTLRFGVSNTTDYLIGTNRLNFTINGSFGSGRYRFSALPTLTDPFGQALDGNADGTGGDAFTRSWTVSGARTNAITVVLGANDVSGADFGNRDLVAPSVIGQLFTYETSQAARISFSEDVGASLSVSDAVLQNLTTNQTIASGDLAVTYNAVQNVARFTYTGSTNGVLPDGNYRLTLAAAGVTDGFGNPLTAPAVLDFFVLGGDANRDRTVDIADFSTLSVNYNSPGTFSGGDFDYNGSVGLGDFAILAANYNVSLPAARTALSSTPVSGNQREVGMTLTSVTSPTLAPKTFGATPLRDEQIADVLDRLTA